MLNHYGGDRRWSVANPKQFFRIQLQSNIDTKVHDKSLLRQTGRSTRLVFRVCEYIRHRKIVATMCSTRYASRQFVSRIVDIGNQVPNMPRLAASGDGQVIRKNGLMDSRVAITCTPDLMDLRGVKYDVLVMDNDVLESRLGIEGRRYDPIWFDPAWKLEMNLPRQEDSKKTVVTSDGEEFKIGDLIRWGDGAAMIVDIEREHGAPWPTGIVVVSETRPIWVAPENVEVFEKVT